MKKQATLILIFFSLIIHAQIKKLSELSSEKFLDSKVIFEDNGEDVFGYFLLYEKDRKNKDVFELEYVILDKNLNKIASNTFNQSHFGSMWVDMIPRIFYVKKNKDVLYLSIAELPNGLDYLGLYAIRTLNIKNYKMSKQTYFFNFAPIEQIKDKLETKDFKGINFFKTIQNGFLVSDENPEYGYFVPNEMYKRTTRISFFDFSLKEKWVLKVNDEKSGKSFCKYDYLTDDKKNIIFKKSIFKNLSDKNETSAIVIFDIETGVEKYQITLNDQNDLLDLTCILLDKDKLTFFADISDNNKKGIYKEDKKTGIVKINYDVNTGKELDRNYFKWTDLSSKVEVEDQYGKLKTGEFIQFMDYKPIANGNVIVIGESYIPKKNSEILDLYMFEFDNKMKLINFNKLPKTKNKINDTDARGNYLKAIGAFDYMYSQKLPDEGYVFYYTDNEKEGRKNYKNPDWVLGIITYLDGKFDYQKIALKTSEGNITPVIAKNGYILLREETKDGTQLRLEKINY